MGGFCPRKPTLIVQRSGNIGLVLPSPLKRGGLQQETSDDR